MFSNPLGWPHGELGAHFRPPNLADLSQAFRGLCRARIVSRIPLR